MLESRSLSGMNGLNAVRPTVPGKFGSSNLSDATGKRPSNVLPAKCGMPTMESRRAPKPKLREVSAGKSPVRLPRYGPFKTRASSTLPFCSAFTEKCEMPLVTPLFGRLRISQSISRPAPDKPIETGADAAERKRNFPRPSLRCNRTRPAASAIVPKPFFFNAFLLACPFAMAGYSGSDGVTFTLRRWKIVHVMSSRAGRIARVARAPKW